jgi:phosphatidylserine decarboxylase
VSQLGSIANDQMIQAKGLHYTVAALLADERATPRYSGGQFACLYLAPYNYHRIHMPLAGRLTATRYVPGALFSVSTATARAIPGLFARNERVVCEFDTALGPLAVVLVGALFVGSIETVFAGEINPPAARGGAVRSIPLGVGREFARGDELGRFNMGSTVIVLAGRGALRCMDSLRPGATVRMGQRLAQAA